MRSSRGRSASGSRLNDSGSNSRPHQGQFSSGIGDGLWPGVALERAHLRARRVGAAVPFPAQDVRRGRLPHPEADLERPRAVPPACLASLDLQRADQPRRPRELIERQQPQRVAHDDAHAGSGEPVVAGMTQAPQHHRHRGQPQVRLGLPPAGREEQQVHGLAVLVERIGEARQVQQQERELERPPARPGRSDLLTEPLAQGPRHRPVRHPEGVQQIRVLAEPRHPVGHAVGRHRRVVQQLLGRIPPRTSQRTALDLAPACLDPAAVLLDEGAERLLRRPAAVQPSQDLHRQLDPGNVRRRRLLNLGRGDPGGADGPALAVLEVPLGRDAMPGGVLRRVGIVQVGDLLVPFRGVRPAQVRPRHEAVVRPRLDLGLEGVGTVGLLLVRRAPVHQEARHRARARGQLRAVRPHRVDRALGDVKLQPPGAGDVPHDRPCGPAERERQHRLVRSPPPDRRPAAARVLDLGRRIVAPAHRDRQLTASRGNERAQSDRRREERLARRLPLVVRLLGQTRRLGNRVEVVVLVGIGAPVRRRAGRDEEAGDVPVRRALAARQLLGRQLMAGPGTDQIEPQCLDEARADLTGIGGNVLGSWHGNRSGTLH